MRYTSQYANTTLYSTFDDRRTGGPDHRAPLLPRFYRPAVLYAPGQRGGAADDRHCSHSALQRPDRPQCHLRVPRVGAWRPPAPILTPPYDPGHVRCRRPRPPAGVAPSEPPDLWQTHQPLDTRLGGRDQLCPGADDASGQRGDYPGDPGPDGGALEAGQTLDHQPRSGLRPKKKRRDRLIRLAQTHVTWALGWSDEVWWSRLAQLDQPSWGDRAHQLRLQE